MSAERFLLLSIAVAALATIAVAQPINGRIDVSDAVNRTICPIEFDYDINPDRIPEKIKVIKCAETPNPWCVQQQIPRSDCCQHQHHNHVMSCAEIFDTVLVYIKSSEKTVMHEVSVGCTCMVNESKLVKEVKMGP